MAKKRKKINLKEEIKKIDYNINKKKAFLMLEKHKNSVIPNKKRYTRKQKHRNRQIEY